MRKILLTGGVGYIGTHTAIALTNAGYDVVLYDNLSNCSISTLDKLNLIVGKNLYFIEGDIRDSENLKNVFKKYKIDAVIHFAGLKSVEESVEKPIVYYDNNVSGTINLLNSMHLYGIKKLVFSSSATVYGKPVYLPFDEEHPTIAIHPYGRCKILVEQMLKDLVAADSDLSIISLRYFNPAGAHESGLIGESPLGPPNNLMPYISQVASGERKFLKIFGNDYPTKDGTGIRDYIHVMDLAEGHLAAVEYLSSQTGYDVFNLGTGKGYTVLDVVHDFEIATGKSISIKFTKRRPGDISEFYSDVSKAHTMLKWKVKRSLTEMCKSSWDFQSKFRYD